MNEQGVAPVVARARELRACAARRWLVKDELVFLLRHVRQQNAIPCHRSLLHRPPSGTLIFYDVKDVPDFKKDGWRWQKRKDNSGRVREDRAKLVINREVIILGTYVHSAETPTFHRRNYHLRDATDGIMLVHYFDEVHKGISGGNAGLTLPLPMPPRHQLTPNGPKGFKRALPTPTPTPTPTPPTFKLDPFANADAMDSTMRECFAMDSHPTIPHDSRQSIDSTPSLASFDDHDADALLSELSSLLSPCAVVEPVAAPLVAISDFSPDWDFVFGGAKVLVCLASALPTLAHQHQLFVQFGPQQRVPAECLSTTVIRCSAPPACSGVADTVDLFVCASVSANAFESIQLSTRGRFQYRMVSTTPTPTNIATDGNVQLVGVGKRGRSPVANQRLDSCGFTAAPTPPTETRRRSYPDCINLSAFVDTDLDERQCKIRVVERLAEFQDVIRTTSFAAPPSDANTHFTNANSTTTDLTVGANTSATPTPLLTSATDAPVDDGVIEELSDEALELLSERLIENVVRQLVTVAHNSDELLEELNSLDETGLSLLHYVSFYNYAHLVPLLLAHGAHVNQQSTQGSTSLHLAAGCGHEEVVRELVSVGADMSVLDFDGLTAAERADKAGHPTVAQLLRQQMGDAAWGADALWGTDAMDVDDVDDGAFMQDAQPHPELEAQSSHLSDESAPTPANSRYSDENQEHNRKLLLGAFSTMSLHDKCALSLSISRDLTAPTSSSSSALVSSGALVKRRGSSMSEDSMAALMNASASSPSKLASATSANSPEHSALSVTDSNESADVQSVIADDEASLTKVEAAMELMGPEELQSLEEEACVIQHNVRAWLLRRNCRHMRETTKKLDEAARSIQEDQRREWAAVTVQAAARSMLARRSFLQTRQVTIKVQAATRGVLCRKNFRRMKTHALASLVIQRNVREWLSKGNTLDANTNVNTNANANTNQPTPTPTLTPTPMPTVPDQQTEDEERFVRELNAALDTADAFHDAPDA